MWIPFACIFIGMAQEFGSAGVSFARFVDGFFPGLLTARGSNMSLLTSISMFATFGMMFAAMALLFGAPILGMVVNRKILRNGKTATARIVSVNDTGTYINNQPLVHITMEVQREDGSPFQAETERILGYSQLARFQAGATVNVRYDPDTLETAISD
jgi:Na+-translocating ferredoxin:NAD+ oxidoreductase RnfE subunit